MLTQTRRVMVLLAATIVVAAACGSSPASPTATTAAGGPSTAPATQGPTAPPAATFAIPNFEPAALRWYCCLGGGEEKSQVKVENDIAAGFAAKYPGSSLKFEATTYNDAPSTLKTQILGGNAPDVVGPVGVFGIASFAGQWADMTPYIEASHYDLSQFPQNLVDFTKTSDGQVGVPFDVYPSMLWYKRGLFEEIGLAEPPHKYGDKYTMPDGTQVDWSYDTVRQLAMQLTVDNQNRDATDPNFDPKHIVQYGFEPQRDDLRGMGAYFGAGTLDSGDGKTVKIPDAWAAGWKWVYNGIWVDHFIMNDQTFNSKEFGSGDPAFFSGKVAMSANFLWATWNITGAGDDWNLGALPSYNGTVTAPLNADTFGILKGSKHPDAAFAAVAYMQDDARDKLLPLYGGMPARESERAAFLDAFSKTEGYPPDVDWQVASDSVQYADVPNFEGPMPKYSQTNKILGEYLSKWMSTGGLDMDAEIEHLRADIQAAWDAQ